MAARAVQEQLAQATAAAEAREAENAELREQVAGVSSGGLLIEGIVASKVGMGCQ